MSDQNKEFDTKEAVERLKHIGTHLPEFSCNTFIEELCEYLAKRIADGPILPVGFVMAYLLVIEDARVGKDGFTGAPMPHRLTGQPPILYDIIMKLQEPIARAAFGDEFGDLVRAQLKTIEET